MKDWQQRVIDEKTALDDKIKALDGFLMSISENRVKVESSHDALLRRQIRAMRDYSFILKQRIAQFVLN